MKVDPGTILRLRRFTAYGLDGDTSETLGAPQNEVFVCVVLGTEPWKDCARTMDIERAMAELGWVRAEING